MIGSAVFPVEITGKQSLRGELRGERESCRGETNGSARNAPSVEFPSVESAAMTDAAMTDAVKTNSVKTGSGNTALQRGEAILGASAVSAPKPDAVAREARAAEDLAAIERVLAGDLASYRQLFDRYEQRARAIAFGVVGNRDDAEDVVQDAFLKAYRNLASFRGQSSFYTWFYRIVFNLSIDLSRKRYRKLESSLGESEAIDSLYYHSKGSSEGDSVRGGGVGTVSPTVGRIENPEEALTRSDISRSINTALGTLSADHRAVIVLREIDGLSYTEISDVVGCSKGTVMSRLHHARKKMQKSLQTLLPWYTPSYSEPGAEENDTGSHSDRDNDDTEESD